MYNASVRQHTDAAPAITIASFKFVFLAYSAPAYGSTQAWQGCNPPMTDYKGVPSAVCPGSILASSLSCSTDCSSSAQITPLK